MSEDRRNWWIGAALVAVAITISAVVAYNVGLSQGLAQVGTAAGSPPPYGWHRPWGFGFFPFFLLFLFFFVLKGLWWRPWGHWSYYGPPPRLRDRFDEWHRQAHERMKGGASDS